MKSKNLSLQASFILLILLIASVMLLTFSTSANSQEKSTASPAPETKEPVIKVGNGTLLPTARNLSDVRAMIYPQKALLNHKYHARSLCGVLVAKMDLLENFPVDYSSGILYLKGTITIRVKVDKMHSGYGLTNGHGVKLYVDGKLFLQNDFLLVKDPKIKDKNAKHEWEEIWQYKLDTTRFSDGRHTIVINVCDHFDHYGADLIQCYIRNKKK